jgi:hypothetical protein
VVTKIGRAVKFWLSLAINPKSSFHPFVIWVPVSDWENICQIYKQQQTTGMKKIYLKFFSSLLILIFVIDNKNIYLGSDGEQKAGKKTK